MASMHGRFGLYGVEEHGAFKKKINSAPELANAGVCPFGTAESFDEMTAVHLVSASNACAPQTEKAPISRSLFLF